MPKAKPQRSVTRKTASSPTAQAQNYRHPASDSPMRPEVGTQPQFKKKKPPKTYRYDSSLSPALDWDGQNSARERAEALIAQIEAQVADLRTLKTPSPLAGDSGAVPRESGELG